MKGTGAVYEVRTYGSVRGMRHKPHPTRCGRLKIKESLLNHNGQREHRATEETKKLTTKKLTIGCKNNIMNATTTER